MKVGAIVGRGARKDFIDAHAICLRIGLGKVLSACEERFPYSPPGRSLAWTA